MLRVSAALQGQKGGSCCKPGGFACCNTASREHGGAQDPNEAFSDCCTDTIASAGCQGCTH